MTSLHISDDEAPQSLAPKKAGATYNG